MSFNLRESAMTIEILAPIAELLGTIGIAIRARKNRSESVTVSTPVTCLSFLFVGFIVGLLGAGLLEAASIPITIMLGCVPVILFLVVAWRIGRKAGILLSWSLAALYSVFYVLGFLGVLYVASAL